MHVGDALVEEAEELKVGGLNGGESKKECGGGKRRTKGLMHDCFSFFGLKIQGLMNPMV